MFQTAAINKAQQTTKYVIQCAFNKKIDFIILLRIQAFYVKSKEQEFLVILGRALYYVKLWTYLVIGTAQSINQHLSRFAMNYNMYFRCKSTFSG